MAEFRVAGAGYLLDTRGVQRALTESTDLLVRRAAAEVLSRRPRAEVETILLAVLEAESDNLVREGIFIALLRLGNSWGLEQAKKAFASEVGIWKLDLAEALAEKGDSEAVSYLQGLLRGSDPGLIEAAKVAVFHLVRGGHLAPPVLESWVSEALSADDEKVRASVVGLVPFLKGRGSLRPSLRALACALTVLDASPLVREAARKAVSFKGLEVQCGPKTALPRWLGLPPFLSEGK